MIDVTSIINDPDFNQLFNLIRVTGQRTHGIWTSTEANPVPMDGIVLPAKLDQLQLLPEGQRLLGNIAVYSLSELKMGNEEDEQPDIIEYPRDSGEYYRIAYLRYYAQCVLWYALATRYQRAT